MVNGPTAERITIRPLTNNRPTQALSESSSSEEEDDEEAEMPELVSRDGRSAEDEDMPDVSSPVCVCAFSAVREGFFLSCDFCVMHVCS